MKLYISLFVILTAGGILGYFIKSNNNSQQLKTQNNTVVHSREDNSVNLKLSYFDDFKGVWGEASYSGETRWQEIDSEFNQRSVPGAVTHIPSLKKESIKIIPVARSQVKNDFGYPKIIDGVYKEYGNRLGGYFASLGQAVTSYQTFDVDSDGLKEEIVETADIGGNHPPHYGYVIKNDFIILSMLLESGSIEPTSSGNGFYLRNIIRDDGQPLCCPSGYRLYRIVYEDGFFRPVWEQEVKYIKVND